MPRAIDETKRFKIAELIGQQKDARAISAEIGMLIN